MIEIVGTALNQWDTGRVVLITGVEAEYAHFANKGDSKAVIMGVVDTEAKIPDYLFQTGKPLCVYAVKDGVTIESRTFSVRNRERPENYVYEDDQRNYIYDLITDAEQAIEAAREAANNANPSAAEANAAAEKANKAAASASEAANSATEAATKAAHTAKSLMVVGAVGGDVIHLDDAIDQFIVGMRIFGKTTQAGVPTPDAPVGLVSSVDGDSLTIHVSGKNLFTGWIVGGIDATTGEDVSYSLYRRTEYLPVGGTTKTISVSGVPSTLYNMFAFYDVNKTFISRSMGTKVSNRTVEVPEGAKYFRFTVYKNTDSPGNIEEADAMASTTMIEAGNVSTLYEDGKPIQSATITVYNGLHGITITSGGNHTDANGQRWICDELDLSKGTQATRTKKTTLSADAYTWTKGAADQQTNNTTLFYCIVEDKRAGSVNLMCDRLPVRNVIGSNRDYRGISGNADYNFIYVRLDGVYTLEEFLDWLASNPITIVYELAKQIETPLSEEELAAYSTLHTYRGNTTVSNDAGAWMDLEYAMDAKKYIDSKISSAILQATVE